jgi:hypothetical protein
VPDTVFTNIDWSKTTRVTSVFGTSSRFFSDSRIPLTIEMVLLLPPCFRIGR